MCELKHSCERDEIELLRFIERLRAEKPSAWARVEALRKACFDEASQADLEEHALLFRLGSLAVDARPLGLDFAPSPAQVSPH
jgi:hypothetical protein